MYGGAAIWLLAIGLASLWVVLPEMRHYKTAKLQVDLKMKLLDKFGSSQEFLAYAQTDAGKQFLASVAADKSPQSPQADVYKPVIGAFWWSIVFVVMGCAFFFLRGRVSDTEPAFLIIGTLAVAFGFGLAIATTVACLLRKWWGWGETQTDARQ